MISVKETTCVENIVRLQKIFAAGTHQGRAEGLAFARR
jgi:hypothetical protein